MQVNNVDRFLARAATRGIISAGFGAIAGASGALVTGSVVLPATIAVASGFGTAAVVYTVTTPLFRHNFVDRGGVKEALKGMVLLSCVTIFSGVAVMRFTMGTINERRAEAGVAAAAPALAALCVVAMVSVIFANLSSARRT